MKGWGEVYICIFDGPGLPRGQRSTIHNKRSTNTTAYGKGTSAHHMGTAKSYKKQDLSVRKKQNVSVRKKQDRAVRKNADHYWTNTNRRQSDTEIQKDFQLRFEILGGVGIVSPEKAILKCGTKTKFYSANNVRRGKWQWLFWLTYHL